MEGLFDVTGRSALVTGANGGLGEAVCGALVRQGAHVIASDVHVGPSSEVQNLLGECITGSCRYVPMDLGDSTSRERGIGTIADSAERLDILVNNAALAAGADMEGFYGSLEAQSDEAYMMALEVNLLAPFALVRGLLRNLRLSDHASVVNVSSIYGLVGPVPSLYPDDSRVTPAAYSASKGGLIQLTRHLATVLAPDVRVNALCPGGIWRSQPEQFVENYSRRTPLARMGTEAEMIGAVLWLCSDASAYVTGQVIAVDGGWTAW
jgi:NAD(P)-dependent dehydrogenase (short-subunit alcohol dehydrogenase family)